MLYIYLMLLVVSKFFSLFFIILFSSLNYVLMYYTNNNLRKRKIILIILYNNGHSGQRTIARPMNHRRTNDPSGHWTFKQLTFGLSMRQWFIFLSVLRETLHIVTFKIIIHLKKINSRFLTTLWETQIHKPCYVKYHYLLHYWVAKYTVVTRILYMLYFNRGRSCRSQDIPNDVGATMD